MTIKAPLVTLSISTFKTHFAQHSIVQRKGEIDGCLIDILTLSQTSPGFYVSAVQVFYKSFENTAGKEEIARDEQFLLFHSVFFSNPFRELSSFLIKLRIVVCKFFCLKECKICRLEKRWCYFLRTYIVVSNMSLLSIGDEPPDFLTTKAIFVNKMNRQQ